MKSCDRRGAQQQIGINPSRVLGLSPVRAHGWRVCPGCTGPTCWPRDLTAALLDGAEIVALFQLLWLSINGACKCVNFLLIIDHQWMVLSENYQPYWHCSTQVLAWHTVYQPAMLSQSCWNNYSILITIMHNVARNVIKCSKTMMFYFTICESIKGMYD